MFSLRQLVLGLCTLLASTAIAQNAPGSAPTAAQLAKYDANHNGVLDPAELATMRPDESGTTRSSQGEQVVELSPFTVSGDSDVGYVATSSLAGSRLNTDLKDTAASISVMTKEFLDDIGATNVADAMAWSTNSQLTAGDVLSLASSSDDINSTFFNFNQFRVRGLPATQTKNYFEWALPTDTYNSDRIEEARGPNSILFGIGSAGGVVNSATKRARLDREIRSGTVGISSHGGYRGTIDVNQRFGDKLAVRFNGVYDRHVGARNFNFSQKQMADIAATYQLNSTTTLRAEYETGRVRQNISTNQQATDQYTKWVDAGSKLIAAPIPSSQNAAYGVTKMAATARITYIGNTGSLLNMANQYASSGLDYVVPGDIVPYSVSVSGPGDLRRPHFDTATFTLEHQFGRNTFLELAYNHQQYHTFNQQANTGTRLFVDPNTTLPTGQPNPNAGKYYIESESWAWDYALRSDTTRVSLAHNEDFGKWGKYRIAAMGEYDWRSPRNALMFEVWANHPFNATPENQSNVVVRRQYVSLSDPGSFYYPNPIANGLIQGLTDPVSGQTLSSTWIPRNASNMRDNPEKQKSILAAIQARYFKEHLVLGLGFRLDKLDTVTRGTTRDANGLIVSDYTNNTFGHYDGRTKTLGAVYHITPKISVFYNYSDNFNLPATIFLVPDGRRTGNPEGEGTDYGVAFTLFGGKLYARANYFKTDLVNGANSNYGGSTTAPGVISAQMLNALVDQGIISAAEADSHRIASNTGATYAQLVEGYEFNLTANPTRSWRLQANFSYTDGHNSDEAPEIQAWAATEVPYFRKFPDVAVGNKTIADILDTWEDYNNNELALVGLTLPGNRQFKVNFYTSYRFNEGVLRGLRIGGGYRHQSKLPIGVYPDQSLQYGPSWWDSSFMAGYQFARSPLPWIKRLSLQLNIDNLFNQDDPYITRRVQGTTPEVIRRIVVREPRSWRLTATFDF